METKRTVKKIAPNAAVGCPLCSHKGIKSQTYSDTLDFRGIELDVEQLQLSICESCGHAFHTEAQIRHNFERTRLAYAETRDRLRVRDGLLSSGDIQKVREFLGLTQRDAAVVFGGGPNAFNKYESGEVLQSVAMDRLLRLASQVGRPSVHFLEAVAHRKPIALSVLPGKTVHLPMPSVLYVSDGSTAFSLNNHVSIAKVVKVIESSQYVPVLEARKSEVTVVKAEFPSTEQTTTVGVTGFYLKPTENKLAVNWFVEN